MSHQTITIEEETFAGSSSSSDGDSTVTVIELETTTIEIDLGVEGPRGQRGPASTPIAYQLTDAASINAAHTFTWRPEVWFVDADGDPISFGITHTDDHHVYVQFPAPFTGVMYLR